MIVSDTFGRPWRKGLTDVAIGVAGIAAADCGRERVWVWRDEYAFDCRGGGGKPAAEGFQDVPLRARGNVMGFLVVEAQKLLPLAQQPGLLDGGSPIPHWKEIDAGGLGLFGDALADHRGGGDVAALARDLRVAGEALADVGFGGRGAGQHARAVVGDDAGVDVQVRAVHGQARDALQRDAGARLLGAAQALVVLAEHLVSPYFFFVSLIVTFSSL